MFCAHNNNSNGQNNFNYKWEKHNAANLSSIERFIGRILEQSPQMKEGLQEPEQLWDFKTLSLGFFSPWPSPHLSPSFLLVSMLYLLRLPYVITDMTLTALKPHNHSLRGKKAPCTSACKNTREGLYLASEVCIMTLECSFARVMKHEYSGLDYMPTSKVWSMAILFWKSTELEDCDGRRAVAQRKRPGECYN